MRSSLRECTGPTTWMTQRAGIVPASVDAAWPVGSEPMRSTSARRACSCTGPPARRIAPSTPPPPISPLLAALTTASTCWSTMSPADDRDLHRQ